MGDISILAGRTCVLTGATGGIGGATARRLAAARLRLLLVGRDENGLNALRLELEEAVAATVVADLTEEAGLDRVVRAGNTFGPVDLLINIAGVFLAAPVFDISDAEFDRSLAANLGAPFRLARAFARGMVERRWGRIVNIGSSSSYVGFPNGAAYCAAKHGLLGLSRALHAELSPAGVRVYCVSPGAVKTDMGRQVLNQDFDTFMEPEEVADYIVFLLAQNGNMVSEEVRLNRMVYR